MFIIEKEFIYDEIRGLIWNKQLDTEQINIPPTAARLLDLFIESKGRVLSRDELLNTIWDKYGISPSNNTLNQYISFLRKVFCKIGLQHELIITVPRVGFLMNGDIDVKHIESLSYAKKTKKIKPKVFFYLIVLVSMLIIIPVTLLGFNKHKTADLYTLGLIDDCPVYMLYKNSEQTTEVKLKIAKELILKYAPCKRGSIFIYHPSDSLILTGGGAQFISRCTFQKNNSQEFAGCYDVYKFAKE